MLDLSLQNTELYEIKDKEGNLLTLKNPSQKFFNRIKMIQSLSTDKQIDLVFEVFLDILNLNTQGIVYTMDYVEQFDISIIAIVIKDYFEYVGEQLGKL